MILSSAPTAEACNAVAKADKLVSLLVSDEQHAETKVTTESG